MVVPWQNLATLMNCEAVKLSQRVKEEDVLVNSLKMILLGKWFVAQGFERPLSNEALEEWLPSCCEGSQYTMQMLAMKKWMPQNQLYILPL